MGGSPGLGTVTFVARVTPDPFEEDGRRRAVARARRSRARRGRRSERRAVSLRVGRAAEEEAMAVAPLELDGECHGLVGFAHSGSMKCSGGWRRLPLDIQLTSL